MMKIFHVTAFGDNQRALCSIECSSKNVELDFSATIVFTEWMRCFQSFRFAYVFLSRLKKITFDIEKTQW